MLRQSALHTEHNRLPLHSRHLLQERRQQPALFPLKVRPRKAPVLLEGLQVRPLQRRPAIPAQQIRLLISLRIIRSLTQELNSILRRLNKTFLSRLRVQGLQSK